MVNQLHFFEVFDELLCVGGYKFRHNNTTQHAAESWKDGDH